MGGHVNHVLETVQNVHPRFLDFVFLFLVHVFLQMWWQAIELRVTGLQDSFGINNQGSKRYPKTQKQDQPI